MSFLPFSFQGHIEVICGPMFSGKTEELIRRVRRAQIARQRVQIFKPSFDTRYDEVNVVSHSSQSISSEVVENASEILKKIKDSTRLIAIDEVQFFDMEIISVVGRLADRGFRVICAGLDLDYLSKPFGPIPNLLAIADEVMKIKAICTVCGSAASRSYRVIEKKEQFLLGEKSEYQARCRAHYNVEYPDDSQAISEITPQESNNQNEIEQ
jgi:thymidine kinase